MFYLPCVGSGGSVSPTVNMPSWCVSYLRHGIRARHTALGLHAWVPFIFQKLSLGKMRLLWQ